ncbi:MAG: oxygen-independent coproporphyrinogen III oxidase [Planctomycetota bacterium]
MDAEHLKPGDITPELLQQFDRQAPRYTSYPTAPEFNESFGPEQFADAIRRADAAADPLAMYLHIPFCRELCLFCGCNVVITNALSKNRVYLEHLRKELALAAPLLQKRRTIGQLHLGGGTPTQLSPPELDELMEIVKNDFSFTSDAELSIEVDPRVTSAEHINTLARLGFNRISLGVQDFEPSVQAAVNRIQSEELTKNLFDECRRAGFRSINIDLIYGLPRQTPATFEKTLTSVIDMRPDRAAVFGYAHVPWMKKAQAVFDRSASLPNARERCELFAIAIAKFTSAGYRSIGLDHFALPTDDLTKALDSGEMTRSFQGYTTRPAEDLLALGHSSVSDLGGAYAQNARTLPEYESSIDAKRLATCRGYLLSKDDLLRRHVIMKVMSATVMHYCDIEQKFGISFRDYFKSEVAELQLLADQGLVRLTNETVSVTPIGRIFIRNVAMVFDRFLREKGGRKQYSRTV